MRPPYLCVQYTPEWWETRRGVPTASQFDRILTPNTMKTSKGQAKYMAELVGETADLRPNWFTDRPMNAAQRHGLEFEHEARSAYSMKTGNDVQMVGFCYDDDLRAGCSPDGLILRDQKKRRGVLELKCVQMATQVEYAMDNTGLLNDYRSQVHGHLLVTGYDFVHLYSYAPGLPDVLIEIVPDLYTAALKVEIASFNTQYDALLAKLGVKRCYPPVRAERPDSAYPVSDTPPV